jgi:hypothetical protein
MTNLPFSVSIGYLNRSVEFLNSCKDIFEKYLKTSPTDLINEINGILADNAKQEDYKKKVPQMTADLNKKMDEIFSEVKPLDKIARALLEAKGMDEHAKSLPYISSARDFDKKIGYLGQFSALLTQFKEVFADSKELTSKDFTADIDKLIKDKSERDKMKEEQKRITDELNNRISNVFDKTTSWLKVAEGLLELEKRNDLLNIIPRQTRKQKRTDAGNVTVTE